jgi:hypothetical protein
MKRAFLLILLELLATSPVFAQDEVEQDELRAVQREVSDLREEVTRMHLLNLLDLTFEQAQELKVLLDEVKTARDLLREQVLNCQKGMLGVLREVKEVLAGGATKVPEDLAEKYQKLRRKSNEANRNFVEKLKEADDKLAALLTDEQRETIEGYEGDPLAPSKEALQGLGSPMSQAASLLDRVRDMEGAQLERAREKAMQQFLGKLIRDGNMPRERIEAARRKVEEIIGKAWSLDELEYYIWREELAKQLVEIANPPARRETREDPRQRGPELSPAGEALFDEKMYSLVLAKVESLKEAWEREEPDREEPTEK